VLDQGAENILAHFGMLRTGSDLYSETADPQAPAVALAVGRGHLGDPGPADDGTYRTLRLGGNVDGADAADADAEL
jgi:hypothetical protein